VIEFLLAAAEEQPDQIAVVSPFGESTYAELAAWAAAAAAELSVRDVLRFGILEEDPAVVLALLAGSALAGAEACVYPIAATGEAASDMRRLFEHDLVVTSRSLVDVTTVHPRELLESTAPTVAPAAEPRPVMVMTTGTSGFPRGVRHHWERVLRVAQRIKPAPDQRWMLAYGLNQFGGLQILIHVVAARATLVAAESFQPRDALIAMNKWEVSHASGTPTFWRFLLSEIHAGREAAPPLQQVTLGGEAVPGALLERLHETFPDAKTSQIYGATEFGQNVTVRDGLPGLPLSFLEPGGDVQFKVVDGELWVLSAASMLGYFNEDPVTTGDWRPTGDLVEIVGDRIEFRGRKTDVINVGGVKVHPLPVEDRISRVPGVGLVRAYGRPNALSGSIVAVEAVLEPGHDPDVVDREIRDACADLPPAARPRSIKFVPTLNTTGNKMNRGVNR
jgi:acyl-CoA synthetase (AMP-forming)/AMP-acid ligase II